MIDHVSVGVSELARSAEFYLAVLGTLGMVCLVRRESTIGFGRRYPEFWINARPNMDAIANGSGVHICLRARSEDAVRAFHAAAIASGGSDDGPPGPRKAELTPYYAAFVRDPDGNRIEAATFPPPLGT